MAQFESQKKSARNLVLSANRQVTYGEVLADAAPTRRQRFDGSALFEFAPTRRTDAEYSGKGTEFATDGQLTGLDTKFGFKAELDNWLAGWAFAFAMGKEAVTVAPAPYTHTPTFDESTSQAAATTLYVEDTNDVKYKVNDMAISDLTLTIPERGALTLDVNMIGTGRFTQGAMAAAIPALTPYAYLLGSDAVFSFGPTGAPVNLNGRSMSTTIKIVTNAVNHVAPGGGMYGHFVRTGRRAVSVSTVIAAKDADDVFGNYVNDTAMEMKWVINSGANAQMTIDVPNFKLKANKLGTDGNMMVWQIEADQTTMFGAANYQPLTVSIVNATAAYLAAV